MTMRSKQWIDERIQRRAAEHDSRIVSIDPGRAILQRIRRCLDARPSEQLAVRLASDGHPELIHIEDTETTFTVAWTGQYRIVGPSFLYTDGDSRWATTMFGYPTRKLAQIGATGAGRSRNAFQLLSLARAKISNIFG